jgi:cbb3-type cytochrome oxidase maturation protein
VSYADKGGRSIFVPSITSFMSVLILLISVSILIALGFLIAFIWNVRSGQYEDDYTPSVRILFENKPDSEENNNKK